MIKTFLTILTFLICCLGFAQTANENFQKDANHSLLEAYAKNVVKFNRRNPQEKVYLHMDNRSYYIGDTIFFKAYIFNATTHRLTRNSQILYVELLNEGGIELDHKKLKIDGGLCEGSFILSDNYRTGYYEIRAYTRYMLNWGNEPMPWINIQEAIPENKLHPYAISEKQRLNATQSSSTLLKEVFPTPIWEQSIVADANHCQFSRVFPVYMRPEKAGEYKREMDWYPMHTALAIPKETEEELRDDSLRMTFYPEGGVLVAGLKSHIAMEVYDQWGREKTINGYITDGKSSQDTVTIFSTGQRGRGRFTICPKPNKRYYAHTKYRGKHYCYPLPDVRPQGFVLNVTPPIGKGNASFSVSSSQTDTILIGWTLLCRGALVAFDTLSIAKGKDKEINLPGTKMIPGVNQLTLFNVRGEVLAERLFFVPPAKKQSSIKITTQLPDTLRPFEKVTISLQAKASNGYPIQSHFSIAITDAEERGTTFDTGNLCSELLLSSDLKGFIKDVNSYFTHTSDTAMADDIDLLMMIQGWRRYEWQSMSGIYPYIQRFSPERGLQIDGRVISDIVATQDFINASKYKPLGNLSMRIEMKDPYITLSDTFCVDSLGQFHIDFKKDFFGEVPMSITLGEIEGKKKTKSVVNRLKFAYPTINRVFSPSTTPYNYYQCHTPEDDQQLTMTQINDWGIDVKIDNIDIKKRRKRTRDINYDYPDVVSDYYKEWNKIIDQGIPLANYYGCNNYYGEDPDNSEYITDANNENNEIRMHYTFGRSRLWGRIARMSDSIFTYDKERAHRYQVYLMPKTIKVYTNLISRKPLGPAIDVNTDSRPYVVWKPDYQRRALSPKTAPYMLKDGVRHTYCEGYSRVASFYHRDYSTDSLPDTTDYRRTLYWNPSVTTSVTGKAHITFYNNARTTRLHIRAEGLTRDGELIVYDSEKNNYPQAQ